MVVACSILIYEIRMVSLTCMKDCMVGASEELGNIMVVARSILIHEIRMVSLTCM